MAANGPRNDGPDLITTNLHNALARSGRRVDRNEIKGESLKDAAMWFRRWRLNGETLPFLQMAIYTIAEEEKKHAE